MDRVIRAALAGLAMAHTSLDAVDRATHDAALDLVTETAPAPLQPCFDGRRGLTTPRHVPPSRRRATRPGTSALILEARSRRSSPPPVPPPPRPTSTPCVPSCRRRHSSAAFPKPEGTALAYAVGLAAGIVQVLAFGAKGGTSHRRLDANGSAREGVEGGRVPGGQRPARHFYPTSFSARRAFGCSLCGSTPLGGSSTCAPS
jgi:hypothetical protein